MSYFTVSLFHHFLSSLFREVWTLILYIFIHSLYFGQSILSFIFVTHFSNFIVFIFMWALSSFTMEKCCLLHLCIQIHPSCLWCFFHFSIFKNLPLLHRWDKYVILSSLFPQGIFFFLYLIPGPIWNLFKCMVWGMDLK